MSCLLGSKALRILAVSGLMALGMGMAGCDQHAVYQPAVAQLLAKADALKKANQPQEALCRLIAAEDIDPESYPVQYNLGVLYVQLGQEAPAIAHLTHALTLKPGDANTLYTLGFAYEGLGDQYAQAANAKTDTERAQLPEFVRSVPPAEAQQKSREAFQHAVETYQQFMQVAPDVDPEKAKTGPRIQALQQRLAK